LPSPLPEVGKFTAGPPGTADAALASDNDNPAAPNTGRALLRRLCFEFCLAWGIVTSSMLDRWAAFRSDSRHICTRVITSLRSHSFKLLHVTKSQVRLTALKESMQAKGRAKVRDAVRKRWANPLKTKRQRRDHHGHDQARLGRRIKANAVPAKPLASAAFSNLPMKPSPTCSRSTSSQSGSFRERASAQGPSHRARPLMVHRNRRILRRSMTGPDRGC
jgi:hypothetical protein